MSAAVLTDDEDLPDVPAVENGQINYLSVSQLKSAAEWTEGGCLRKWYLKKVVGLPEPTSASLELGKKVHAQLEHYLKTGEDVLGEIARAALPYLPAPKSPGLKLESSITASNKPITGATVDADGIPLVGFIDREEWDRAAVGVVRVVDYKTSKNPQKYAATPDELATTKSGHGIQMVGYARSVFKRAPNVVRVDPDHLTLHTKPTKAIRDAGEDVVEVKGDPITPEVADREWKRIHDLAARLRVIAKAKGLGEVPPAGGTFPNASCDAFRGCAFFAQCLIHESQTNPKADTQEQPQMSLRDLLAKKQATAPAPVVALPEMTSDARKLELEVIAKAEAEALARKATEAPAILPPDAPKSDPAKAAEPLPEAKSEAPAAELEKPKRGRKPKVNQVADAVIATAAAQEAETEPQAGAGIPAELTIFYNCVPSAPVNSLLPYISERVAAILKAFPGVFDLRCAPKKSEDGKDHPLAFGGWKGVLSASVKLTPPEPGPYMLIGDDEIAQVVADALAGVCSPGHFIRGVR